MQNSNVADVLSKNSILRSRVQYSQLHSSRPIRFQIFGKLAIIVFIKIDIIVTFTKLRNAYRCQANNKNEVGKNN